MSLVPYKVTALKRLDASGLNIVPDATVSVTSGASYAQIWEEEAGTTPIGNPFDCDSNGEREFWILPGEYLISVAGGQSWNENIGLEASYVETELASRVQFVDSIAELQAFTGTANDQQVSVDGVIFVAVSSDTTSSDNGISVVVDADGMRWYNYNQISVDSLTTLATTRGLITGQLCYVTSSTGGFYRWNNDSTETNDGDRTISVSGVTTGRWIKRDQNNIVDIPANMYEGVVSTSGSGTGDFYPYTAADSQQASILAGRQTLLFQMLRGGVITPPAGFDFNPPFGIVRHPGGSVSTDFDVSDYRNRALNTYVYIDPIHAANDSGDGLTWATAKKSLTNALNGSAETIYLAPGIYNRDAGSSYTWTVNANRAVNVICPNGRAKLTRRWQNGATWTNDGGGVFHATRGSVANAYDTVNRDEYGDYSQLTQYVTLVALQAATSGFFNDAGSVFYVKRIDGLEPSFDNTAVFLVEAVPAGLMTGAGRVYIENLDFEGGDAAFRALATGGGDDFSLYHKNCTFKYGTANDGLEVFGATEVFGQNSVFSKSYGDGASYHYSATNGSVAGRFIEVDCIGRHNGLKNTGAVNSNGSTAHDGWLGVRVNCSYYANRGPNVADVTDATTWNIAVSSTDGIGAGGSVDGFQIGGGDMWLDGCHTSGNTNAALLAGSSGQMHIRLSDIIGDVTVNSGAHIDDY